MGHGSGGGNGGAALGREGRNGNALRVDRIAMCKIDDSTRYRSIKRADAVIAAPCSAP
jgi:hypothetical protein